MPETVKTLTMIQPWASLIALGAKHFETRHWTTSYRGLIAIHAGKALEYDRGDRRFLSALARAGIHDPEALPRGAVLAIHWLGGIYHTEDVRDRADLMRGDEVLFGNFADGRSAWDVGRQVYAFETPVQARGQQGLWEWTLPPGLMVADLQGEMAT